MKFNLEQPEPSQQEKTPQELKQELGILIVELNRAIENASQTGLAEDLVKADNLQQEVEKKMRILEEQLIISPEKARKIMGENFYGPEEIENALGFKIDELEIPKISYKREVLERAKKLGERLILRISHDVDGNPMTMERISQLGQVRMINNAGKFWRKDEYFYKKNPLKTEWKLVGGSFVENSTDQNYFHQTMILRNYLRLLGSLSVEEEAECSDESLKALSEEMGIDWNTQEIKDRDKYNINWKIVAHKLAELKINQNHRRTPAEIIYDWLLEFKKTKNLGFLKGNYEWSNSLFFDGDLVRVGCVDVAGVSVASWNPVVQLDNLGVVSVR